MLQTNAYVSYCKYMKIHDEDPMSHLDFCKKIAIAWLDPYNNWPKFQMTGAAKKRTENDSVGSDSSKVTTRSASKKQIKSKRSRRFTDTTLNPIKGLLNDRLHQVQHWPVTDSVTSAAVCQLHRWATKGGERRRGNLFRCSYCEVTLCGKCFLTYHTVVDLQVVKNKLRIEMGCEEDEETLEESSLCTTIFDHTEAK